MIARKAHALTTAAAMVPATRKLLGVCVTHLGCAPPVTSKIAQTTHAVVTANVTILRDCVGARLNLKVSSANIDDARMRVLVMGSATQLPANVNVTSIGVACLVQTVSVPQLLRVGSCAMGMATALTAALASVKLDGERPTVATRSVPTSAVVMASVTSSSASASVTRNGAMLTVGRKCVPKSAVATAHATWKLATVRAIRHTKASVVLKRPVLA